MTKHKQLLKNISGGDSGFTIIESLVGLLVASLLLAAISPVIVIATATRVQSRRVELATRAARTFIDGVRTGTITQLPSTIPNGITTVTPNGNRSVSANAGDYLINTKMDVPSSASTLYCYTSSTPSTVSTDPPPNTIANPDCHSISNNLFYIQAAQIQVPVTGTTQSDNYRLAIRVYRADIDFTKTINANTSTTNQTESTFTGGIGDKQSPLVEMITDVSSTNLYNPTSFTSLCQRLGVATNQNCQ